MSISSQFRRSLLQWRHGRPSSAPPRPPRLSWWMRFKRQELPGLVWTYHVLPVALTYFVLSLLLLPLGAWMLADQLSTKSVSIRYDQVGPLASTFNLSTTMPHTMHPPLYVYVELSSYYQNYRRYVRSRDSSVTSGHASHGATAACEPIRYLGGASNASLVDSGAINPCGLIAWSSMNDSFALYSDTTSSSSSSSRLALDESREAIAWTSDYSGYQKLFGASSYARNFPNNDDAAMPSRRGGRAINASLPLNQDAHLVVWMRVSPTAHVRKLYAVLHHTTLTKGSVLTIQVDNHFNTYTFGGEKQLFIREMNWLGGRNVTLPVALLSAGSLALLIALTLLALFMTRRHKPSS